jgi:hypothetical protein
VGHPGHARPRLPGRGGRDRTQLPAATGGLIPLTCNELQHLFAALVARPVDDLSHRLRWSTWRRRHQARARTCHYRRHAVEAILTNEGEGQARGFGWTGPFPDCSGLSMRHDEAEAITDQLTGVVYERALSPAERAEFAELVGSVGSRILG